MGVTPQEAWAAMPMYETIRLMVECGVTAEMVLRQIDGKGDIAAARLVGQLDP